MEEVNVEVTGTEVDVESAEESAEVAE